MASAKPTSDERIHLEYKIPHNDRQIRRENQNVVATAQTTCCIDVWQNMRNEGTTEPITRQTLEQEKFKLSIQKVLFKQLVSLTLFGLLMFYFFVTNGRVESSGSLFQCDPDANDSLTGVKVLSLFFLFPYLLESLSIVTIIWVSSINDEVLIPISDGLYVGFDELFNEVMSSNPLIRTLSSVMVLWYVPRLILRIANQSEAGIPTILLILEMIWKFAVFMLPDVLLTLALFPTSYLVMVSSQSPEDLVVNLVAVQVLATLDDQFVKTLLRPRASVGDAIQNYLSVNPEAVTASYSPLEAYLLTENRNEMGVKVARREEMKEFHYYEGMHLFP